MAKITGGDKAVAALARIAELLGDGGSVKVGFLEGATYPTGSSKSLRKKYAKRKSEGKAGAAKGAQGGLSVATVAALQNFGTSRIPPRPFFSNMVAEKAPEWPDAVAATLKVSHYDVERTLGLVGEAIAGQLRQSIIDTNFPPLAQSTIDRKGFDKPLVDTSHMLNSVDYEVSV